MGDHKGRTARGCIASHPAPLFTNRSLRYHTTVQAHSRRSIGTSCATFDPMKLLLYLLLPLALLSCKKDEFDRKATYEVSCNGCTITYLDQYGDSKTLVSPYDWGYTFKAEAGQELSVSIQPTATGNRIKASITCNGATLVSGDASTSTDGRVNLSVPAP